MPLSAPAGFFLKPLPLADPRSARELAFYTVRAHAPAPQARAADVRLRG